MNVGIYLDLRNPPSSERDEASLYAFSLALCEEAERLGLHSVWVTEHHQFDDGYLPQPLTFAAAVAARTHRVRIGTAVIVAPLHHPVHLAEQAAIVDLVSAGRLDIGIGAGYRPAEYQLFGVDAGRRYSTTDACARDLRRMWADGTITPAPVQDPLPLWLGYQGPQGARRAGLLGEGLLSVDAKLLAPYRAGLAEGGHDPASARMAGVFHAWVSDDPEADREVVGRHLEYQVNSYRRHLVAGTGRPPPRHVTAEEQLERGPNGPLGYFVLGTAADVADAVGARAAGAPVETVFLWASVGGMDEDLVVRHVRAIAGDLAPLLADV